MSDLFHDLYDAVHTTRRFGQFKILVTRGDVDSAVPADLIVLVRGSVDGEDEVPFRIASACVTSTALDSADCDCREQLDAAMCVIDAADRGVVLYMTNQEGRGHGLAVKIRALANKNAGADTFEAVRQLGLEPDVRTYEAVPVILEALGVRSIVMLGSSPVKRNAVMAAGVKVQRMQSLAVSPHSNCRTSLRAKRDNGHAMNGHYMDAPSLPYP